MAYTNINKSSDYFNTKLYTGNGSTQNITGVGHQPDFTWIKDRSTTNSHRLFDAVRGATEKLYSNLTNAESTDVNSLTAWTTDGFNIGTDGGGNTNSNNYVAWNWKANGAGSANTDGTITSTVSANTTSGFSIVSYTGTGANATVGHGLGVVPKVVIVKRRNLSANWYMWHKGLANDGKNLLLNTTDSEETESGYFNDTAPSSSLVSLGTSNGTNGSYTYIAYCFAEKTGYSKFGSYTGNASTDGAFCYTGFKPAWILLKNANGANSWRIYDVKRLGYNVYNSSIIPNSDVAEQASEHLDILSNGFKLRTSGAGENGSGSTFIYMAFAEAPLVGSNNVPCTAR